MLHIGHVGEPLNIVELARRGLPFGLVRHFGNTDLESQIDDVQMAAKRFNLQLDDGAMYRDTSKAWKMRE